MTTRIDPTTAREGEQDGLDAIETVPSPPPARPRDGIAVDHPLVGDRPAPVERQDSDGPAPPEPPALDDRALKARREELRRRTDQGGDLAVVANSISKAFGSEEVVKGLSFEVPRGQIFGIIGPSGSGKTTTIRMLLGVLKPTKGDLFMLGREPSRFRRREREHLGYMPQLFVLFPELSVTENLGFAASIYGMGFWGRGKRIRRVLELVDLWDARGKTASQLSGGMQRRLELAATLIHNPEIVFLDEPTAGIDPVLRARFWDHFRELRDQGRTLIVTTQYVTESEHCDQILVLKDGEGIADGSPEAVRRQAMGGEVVTVIGPGLGNRQDRRPQELAVVERVDGYKDRRRRDYDTLEVIVDDAGTAVPLLIDAFREADIEVDEVSEEHPSFDDVFVRLMGGDRDPGSR